MSSRESRKIFTSRWSDRSVNAARADFREDWTKNLINDMKDPSKIVYQDELVMIIRDKYPKARVHYLVLPKKDINTVKDLTKDDLPLLEHIEKIAYDKIINLNPTSEFKLVYVFNK